MDNFICACNKKPCEGTCRKTNLYRKRRIELPGGRCPAAYDQLEERRRIR